MSTTGRRHKLRRPGIAKRLAPFGAGRLIFQIRVFVAARQNRSTTPGCAIRFRCASNGASEDQRKKLDEHPFVVERPGEHGKRRQEIGSSVRTVRKTLRERTIASGDGPRVNDDPDVQGEMR
jgi:hypothetical protein